eukprot:COSAG01_NODE_3048_length_6669_cov_138.195282_3_plen_71_part_00
MVTPDTSVSARDRSCSVARRGLGFDAVVVPWLMCKANGRCDGDEGMAEVMKMAVVVCRCRNGQEMRRREL